ncbi:MAG: DNA repair protein RecO [Agarilytica sp.]
MSIPIEEQPAFLIHSRKYTDSRILVELLTRDYGRVSAVLRQGGKSRRQIKIQPFTPLLVSWKGSGGLKTVTYNEMSGAAIHLLSDNLFCGMYLNELLLRCLPQEDACEAVYSLYYKTVSAISILDFDSEQADVEAALRVFEFTLLGELGFGIDMYCDIHQSEIVQGSDLLYRFEEGLGFVPVFSEVRDTPERFGANLIFPADVIVALREARFDERILKYAKMFSRQVLRPLLGDRPLNSRALFTR